MTNKDELKINMDRKPGKIYLTNKIHKKMKNKDEFNLSEKRIPEQKYNWYREKE